jgi:hypothetical protein
MFILSSYHIRLGWSLGNLVMVRPLTQRLVAAVEVAVDVEITKTTVIVGLIMISVVAMREVAMVEEDMDVKNTNAALQARHPFYHWMFIQTNLFFMVRIFSCHIRFLPT